MDDNDDDYSDGVILFARSPSQRAAASSSSRNVISSPEFPIRSPLSSAEESPRNASNSLIPSSPRLVNKTLVNEKKWSKKKRRKPLGSPFERLYRKAKEQEQRKKVRAQLELESLPPDCTFTPMTTAVEGAMSPMKATEMVRRGQCVVFCYSNRTSLMIYQSQTP